MSIPRAVASGPRRHERRVEACHSASADVGIIGIGGCLPPGVHTQHNGRVGRVPGVAEGGA